MDTATKIAICADGDVLAARRFADTIVHMLKDFIPENSRRDAWDMLAKAAFDQHFELTSFQMRKQYEAWRETQIDILKMQPTRDFPTATP